MMKIAASKGTEFSFITQYPTADIDLTDFTDICAVVSTIDDIDDVWQELERLGFDIPIFAAIQFNETVPAEWLPELYGVIEIADELKHYNGQLISAAAADYIDSLDPPFFQALKDYTDYGNAAFDCPGHQGGQFFRKHPSGLRFYRYFGETLFRSDSCNADVRLGDLLIHEGPAFKAQAHAAQVFNADKTYFVLNGTSAANKIAIDALVVQDDLILFDRNNHKSVHLGALVMKGANPIYMETTRNAYGFIGGIPYTAFDEESIRAQIAEIDPERAKLPRPFRLAVIQLGTYDGTIYNARQVVDRIGHLCDYILFDSAWVGYEQFIPMMRDCSPLLLELNENDPGILVTQSVHKQQAGFSQASQIHKKDNHINKQERYCNHKHFNNAFMMHASTSPFYPLFASLDVNAKMHAGKAGSRMWQECVLSAIEARKMLLQTCTLIRPFVPPIIDGKAWQNYDSEEIMDDIRFFQFGKDELWHDFDGYANNQYFIDPCKLLLTTPGIDMRTGEYEKSGIPAAVLAHYLRERSVIPEKADLNSILFLLTPAENMAKFQHLVANIARFEELYTNNVLVSDMLPTLVKSYPRYRSMRIQELCQQIHNFYAEHKLNQLQQAMFKRDLWPVQNMTPFATHTAFTRNRVELVPLAEIRGRVAAEGALPYPPGILCIVPGEVWEGPTLDYFLALEKGINLLPGFEPEIQGLYLEENEQGYREAFAYVVKHEYVNQ